MLNIFARVKYFCLLSVRGVSDAVRAPADAGLVPADPGHAAAVAALLHQGGAGAHQLTFTRGPAPYCGGACQWQKHFSTSSICDLKWFGTGKTWLYPRG